MMHIRFLIIIIFMSFSLSVFSQFDRKKEFMRANSLTENDLKYTKQPRFPGGDKAWDEFYNEIRKYPKVVQDNTIGQVIAEFTVEEDGSVTNPTIRWGTVPEFDKEILRRILMMPKWEPGEVKGEKRAMKVTLVNTFGIKGADFDVYDLKLPEFANEEFDNKAEKYIAANISYPQDALEQNKQGLAFVQFTVDKKGKLKNVKLLTTTRNKSLDDEALRVVKNMPDWEPGKIDGKETSVRCVIPVEFRINKEQ